MIDSTAFANCPLCDDHVNVVTRGKAKKQVFLRCIGCGLEGPKFTVSPRLTLQKIMAQLLNTWNGRANLAQQVAKPLADIEQLDRVESEGPF
jgi:hypothetical protein